jgi:hypothetical protein
MSKWDSKWAREQGKPPKVIRMLIYSISVCKVETPYHDNDLVLTPIISPQSGWQWTWSCPELHMGGFRDGGWQF